MKTIWDSKNKGTYIKSRDGLIGTKEIADAKRLEIDKAKAAKAKSYI